MAVHKPNAFLTHLRALTLKESRQVMRDKSAILLGVFLPIVLIFIFGYGLSFDIKDVKLGVVNDSGGATSTLYTQALRANASFKVTVFDTRLQAQEALHAFEIEAMLVFDEKARAQLLIDGVDAPRATMLTNAVMGVMGQAAAAHGRALPGVTIVPRIWFNESAESRWYLVPGLLVVILTMVGTMLTGLVIAREWERGTMEALMATPITPLALLLSKIIPYFALALIGWSLCMGAALFVYDVPLRGSLWVITLASVLYLLFCLGLGLIISAVTRSQFLSSQITLLASFLPALLLSGFIFDLRSAPVWAEGLGMCLPPAHFLQVLKIGFLSAGMWPVVFQSLAVLGFWAAAMLALALKVNRKCVRM